MRVADGAQVSTKTSGEGNSGSIAITNADKITIQNNGSIEVSNLGTGTGGTIDIEANSLALDRGLINAESNSADGGDINVNLGRILTLRNRSSISATSGIAGGAGNGGNINIDVPLIFAFPRKNEIRANAFSGSGGNINIRTNAIFGYPQFLTITASSNLGIAGTINITGRNEDITKETIQLTQTLVNAEEIIAKDVCKFENDEIASGSSFTIIGKGGIATNPRESFEANQRLVEWSQGRSTSTLKKSNATIKTKPVQKSQIKQVVGWWRKSDGTVVLTANPEFVRPLNVPLAHPSCDATSARSTIIR